MNNNFHYHNFSLRNFIHHALLVVFSDQHSAELV